MDVFSGYAILFHPSYHNINFANLVTYYTIFEMQEVLNVSEISRASKIYVHPVQKRECESSVEAL
jgi:hypothetical protein